MKRNWDVIREIALAIEADNLPAWTKERTPEQCVIHNYQMSIMNQMELINGLNLTWEGHDFCDMVRNPEAWSIVQREIEVWGGLPYDILKEILLGYSPSSSQTMGLRKKKLA